MRVIDKCGVAYPCEQVCEYCGSAVELEYHDTTIENYRPADWEYTQEMHLWTCPICGERNRIEGRAKD